MKKILSLFVFGLLVFSGCKNHGTEILNEIIIKEKKVFFEKEGGKKEILVTSEESWAVTVNDSWIKVTQDKDKLVIKVEENKITVERSGIIYIIARGVEPISVEIKQSAGDVQFNFYPNAVTLKASGGSKTVEMITEAKGEVVVSPSPKWLQTKVENNQIVVTAESNDTYDVRSAIIVVKIGQVRQELKVDQEASPRYIFPYLPFTEKVSINMINTFEVDRGSVVTSMTNLKKTKFYWFHTICKNIPYIVYEFYTKELKEEYPVFASSFLDSDKDAKGYNNFILEQGFDKVYTDKYSKMDVYYKQYDVQNIELNVYEEKSTSLLVSEFSIVDSKPLEPKQPNGFATFNNIPYGFGHFNKATKEDVIKWETENGGLLSHEEFNKKKTMFLMVFKINDGLCKERVYYFNVNSKGNDITHELFQYTSYYNNINLGLYLDSNGSVYPTKEFEKLLSDNNFVFNKVDKNKEKKEYTFDNHSKGLRFVIIPKGQDLVISTIKYRKERNSNKFSNYSLLERAMELKKNFHEVE